MIKEEEIAWYRQNVINKYVDEVMKQLEIDENKAERLKHKIPKEFLPDYKRCKRCRKVKPLTEFRQMNKGKIYYRGICKPCEREYWKVHR